jgi:polar amino acid transport system substrate-binding protein
LIRAVTLGFLLLAGAARAAGPESPVFRWGGDAEGGAPFVEADPADPSKLRGFDVEIASLIAKRLGRTPVFVQVAFQSLDQSAARGDFDIGLSGIEDAPQRRKALSVTMPYFEFREVLTVRASEASRFRSLADLRGRRVGTLAGTIAWEALVAAEKAGGILPVSYDDDVHPYEDLAQGRLDAVLLDHVLAARSVRRVPGLAIQAGTVATGRYVAILARENATLRDRIDGILMDAMKDGTLKRIFEEWKVWDESQAAFQARLLAEKEDEEKRKISLNGNRADGTAGALRAAGGADATGAEAAVAGSATPPSSPSKRSPSSSSSSLSLVVSYLPSLLKASLVTITLSCLAMALAVALGVAIASGRVYGSAPVRLLLTAYVEVTRGTPVLLQLFVLYYGLSSVVRLPAFVAALLGLGLNYAAYESEIYRGALEAVPKVQLEAARTLGLTEGQVLRLVRGPLAFRLALAPMTNDFVALLKDSSLVSVVTVVELTKQTAIFATNIASWAVPGALCAALYLAMSLPLARLARRLEGRWRAASA